MNKGFTLIELLAVLVILAIILLIAYPLITRIVESFKRSAFEISAKMIIKAAEYNYLATKEADEFYYLDGKEYHSEEKKLDYSGEKPQTGVVNISGDGSIAVVLHNGQYCATKTASDSKVLVEEKPANECASYIIINTEDNWQDIANYHNIPLDILLALNGATITDPTINVDIKIPISIDGSLYANETISYDSKTFYTVGYVTTNGFSPKTVTYTIDLGNLPLPVEDIESVIVEKKSVISELEDFKRYILRKKMGDVIYPDVEQVYFELEYASTLQGHALTVSNMTVQSVEVTCNTKCSAVITIDIINIDNVNPINVNGIDIVYMPSKFTVDFNKGGSTPEICFVFDELTKAILDYNETEIGCTSDVVIPQKINGIDVEVIADDAFYGKSLTSAVIPSGVISIGEYAFCYNNLTNVTLSNTVTTIGYDAFSDNSLTSVLIPNSVTTIGEGAFSYNDLTSAILSENITSLEEELFYDNKITEIIIPESVTTIGPHAFSGNFLTNVVIPNSVTIIEYGAFTANLLENIVMSSNVNQMGKSIFNNNRLPEAQAFIYGRNPDTSINYSILLSYGGVAKDNVIIPNGVVIIEDGSLWYNGLRSVVIPNTVTTIGSYSFYGNALSSVLIPNSVTKIEESAFSANRILQGNFRIDNNFRNVIIERWALVQNGITGNTEITPTYLR